MSDLQKALLPLISEYKLTRNTTIRIYRYTFVLSYVFDRIRPLSDLMQSFGSTAYAGSVYISDLLHLPIAVCSTYSCLSALRCYMYRITAKD